MKHAVTGERPHKLSSQVEQQHNVNSAGTSLLMVERKTSGSSLLFWPDDALRSIKELPFSCFPSLHDSRRTVKPGSEHVVDPMIRSSINTYGLPLPGEALEHGCVYCTRCHTEMKAADQTCMSSSHSILSQPALVLTL